LANFRNRFKIYPNATPLDFFNKTRLLIAKTIIAQCACDAFGAGGDFLARHANAV